VKKCIALLLAGMLLASLSACGKDIGIIGDADDPTAIIVADDEEDTAEKKVPARIEHEYTHNNDEHGTHSMVLKAYDENDVLMWEYVTPDSLIAPFKTLEYLGMNNGLVYINESSLYDESTGDDLSQVYGRLRALRSGDGSVVWENTDYSGSSSVFDEDGSVYLTSYIGPDCTKIYDAGKPCGQYPP